MRVSERGGLGIVRTRVKIVLDASVAACTAPSNRTSDTAPAGPHQSRPPSSTHGFSYIWREGGCSAARAGEERCFEKAGVEPWQVRGRGGRMRVKRRR